MLAHERQTRILSLVEEQGTVRTIDLAEEFEVTDETIRRDFQAMEENHQLTRIHGGASSLSGRPKLQSFIERRFLEESKKKAIAATAVQLLEPGKTYAFDSSTTAFALVSILPDVPLRVLTNAYAFIDHLIRMDNIDLISTGGRYDSKTQTFVGQSSHTSLQRYQIQTAFVSCMGLDVIRGASEGYEQQAIFKEHLIEIANEVVLLVDSTKLNQQSEYFFAGLNQISKIITDSEADPVYVELLRNKGCSVIIAD